MYVIVKETLKLNFRQIEFTSCVAHSRSLVCEFYSLSRHSQHVPSLLSSCEEKCMEGNVDTSRENGRKNASPHKRGPRSSVPLSLRLYVCQVSDCQWKSKNHFNYHRHVFSHLKLQAKFQCQYCHKEISSNSGKCGYGQKRFRCSECDIEPMTKLA